MKVLKKEQDEALSKAYRQSVEIKSIESQLDKMVKQELGNIEAQEKEEQEVAMRANPPGLSPFGDIDFSAVDWSLTVPNTPQPSQGN